MIETKFIHDCFENVDVNVLTEFGRKCANLICTSIPFANLELYDLGGEFVKMQSTEKYPTDSLWVDGFFKPLILKSIDCLAAGGVLALHLPSEANNKKLLLCSEKSNMKLAKHTFFDVLKETIIKSNIQYGRNVTLFAEGIYSSSYTSGSKDNSQHSKAPLERIYFFKKKNPIVFPLMLVTEKDTKKDKSEDNDDPMQLTG